MTKTVKLRLQGAARFPLSLEQQRDRVVFDAHCPICDMHQAAMRFIHCRVYSLQPPNSILYELKRNGYVPRDHDGVAIMEENAWEKSLSFHMVQCLNEDPNEYRRQWQAKLDDQRLQAALHNRVAERHIAVSDETDNELEQRKQMMIPAASGALSYGMFVSTDGTNDDTEPSINRDVLIDTMGQELPQIILMQLEIVKREQQRYLNGETDIAPVEQVKTLATMKALLQSLLGTYGMDEIIG